MSNQGDDMGNEQRYPLGATARAQVRSRTGWSVEELTLEALRAGTLTAEDLSIHPDTLRRQAEIAEQAGHPQLAANLRRAAELALLPEQEVLRIYEMLRPYRADYEELLAVANELEHSFGAIENARLVREAAESYRVRGLCS